MLKFIEGKYLSILGWLVLILSVIATYSNLDENGFYLFINSDSLGIPDLYEDVIVGDGKIKDWIIAASTQVFPDAFLYILIAKILPLSAMKVAFAYGLAQVIIFTILSVLLYNKLANNELKKYSWLIPLFISLFFLESFYFTNDALFAFFPISYIYHFGVIINVLIMLLLYFSSFSVKIKYLLIFLFSIVAAFSDKLFLVLLIAPLILTLLFLIKKDNLKSTLFSIASMILGCVIGFGFYHYLKINKLAVFQEVRMNFTVNDVALSVTMFLNQMFSYIKSFGFRSFQIVFTVFSIFGCIVYYLINKEKSSPNHLFLVVFFVFFSVCTFCAPMINGSYTGYDTLRYNVAPFYFTALIFTLFIGFILEKKVKATINKAVSLTTIAIILSMVIIKLNFNRLGDYLNYYPEAIREIDSLSTKYKLKKGISSYWQSRPITMFSRAGLKVSSVYPDGNMYELGTNINRYYAGEFNFIIADTSVPPEVIEKQFKIKDSILTKHYLILLVEDFIYTMGKYSPQKVN